MTLLFVILVVIASVALGLIVLIQNPKGGGLAGNVAGFSNQFMGVKQTTDVLEKGTWIFSAVIGLLCLFSVVFIRGGNSGPSGRAGDIGGANSAPAKSAPAPAAPANGAQQAPVTAPTK